MPAQAAKEMSMKAAKWDNTVKIRGEGETPAFKIAEGWGGDDEVCTERT